MKARREEGVKASRGFLGFFWKLQREDAAAIAVAIIFLFAYLTTLSTSLEEEDSVHFALALTDFNVTQNQPHPPGFPVYVAIGKAFFTATGNELLALTSMSAVFGVLSVLALYVFMRERLGSRRALAAAAICASTPLFWLSGVKALSDMTGLFFTIVPFALLWRYNSCGSRRSAYIGMFISGIAAGVRIHSALLLLPAAVLAFRERKEGCAEILKGASFFVLGACLWVFPLLALSGPSAYMESSSGQLLYRVGNPEISLMGAYGPLLAPQKLYAELCYFLMEGYGVNVFAPGMLGIALLAVLIAVAGSAVRRLPAQGDFAFFSVPLAVYCALVFVLLPAINPRYFLVLVPFISAALAAGAWKLGTKWQRAGALAALCALLLAHSIALASVIHDEKAPMPQMVEYLELMPGREVVVSGSFLYDYVKYYHAGIDVVPEDAGCGMIPGLLKEGRAVFSTRAGSCACIAYSKAAVFFRDMRVHVKRSVAELYALSPAPC